MRCDGCDTAPALVVAGFDRSPTLHSLLLQYTTVHWISPWQVLTYSSHKQLQLEMTKIPNNSSKEPGTTQERTKCTTTQINPTAYACWACSPASHTLLHAVPMPPPFSPTQVLNNTQPVLLCAGSCRCGPPLRACSLCRGLRSSHTSANLQYLKAVTTQCTQRNVISYAVTETAAWQKTICCWLLRQLAAGSRQQASNQRCREHWVCGLFSLAGCKRHGATEASLPLGFKCGRRGLAL